MQLILTGAQRYFVFPYELRPGDKCELWQEASKLAEELGKHGYSGKMKLVCQFKDAVDNSYRSKLFPFDIDDWLGEPADTKRERRYMKQCVSCSNWIPLASETCSACNAKQPER
jgi:hypothetical protein